MVKCSAEKSKFSRLGPPYYCGVLNERFTSRNESTSSHYLAWDEKLSGEIINTFIKAEVGRKYIFVSKLALFTKKNKNFCSKDELCEVPCLGKNEPCSSLTVLLKQNLKSKIFRSRYSVVDLMCSFGNY